MKTIEESAIEDSDDIPSKAKTQLEKAINKCNIIIDEFQDSKYVDDAYYIIGKAGFYRSEYNRALKSFNTLIENYPDSEFIYEAEIWHSYTQFKLGEIDSSQIKLESLLNIKKQTKENKYLIYTALGDINLEIDSVTKAFDYLDLAVKNANDKGSRISIFNKIIKIAEKENAYERAIKYLLLLEKQSDSKAVRRNARMKWIEFNKKLKKYDIILQEIDIMLGTAEYETMYLELELEKAQILIDKGDLISGRSVLLSFIEKSAEKKDNKYKKARAKSYFILGESSLFDEFDFASSREYFDKMTEEYNRSENRNKANKLLDMMDEFDVLKESYRKSLKSFSEVISDTIIVEIDSLLIEEKDPIENEISDIDTSFIKQQILEETFNPEKNKKAIKSSQSLKNKFIIGTPDSLLMLIGEMLVYDFGRMDSAANRYKELVSKFPESKFSPRAMYALTFYSIDSLDWKVTFNEKYPNPDFLIEKEEKHIADDFSEIRMKILENFSLNPINTRDSLNKFFNRSNDPDALYLSAYISDYILNDLENSKHFYKVFVDSFPSHNYYNNAKNRFSEIEKAILDTMQKSSDSMNIIELDSNSIKIDTLAKYVSKYDSIMNFKDTTNRYELLKNLDIQLDSNFKKSELLKYQKSNGSLRQ